MPAIELLTIYNVILIEVSLIEIDQLIKPYFIFYFFGCNDSNMNYHLWIGIVG